MGFQPLSTPGTLLLSGLGCPFTGRGVIYKPSGAPGGLLVGQTATRLDKASGRGGVSTNPEVPLAPFWFGGRLPGCQSHRQRRVFNNFSKPH